MLRKRLYEHWQSLFDPSQNFACVVECAQTCNAESIFCVVEAVRCIPVTDVSSFFLHPVLSIGDIIGYRGPFKLYPSLQLPLVLPKFQVTAVSDLLSTMQGEESVLSVDEESTLR